MTDPIDRAIKAMEWAKPFLDDGAIGDERMVYDKTLRSYDEALQLLREYKAERDEITEDLVNY